MKHKSILILTFLLASCLQESPAPSKLKAVTRQFNITWIAQTKEHGEKINHSTRTDTVLVPVTFRDTIIVRDTVIRDFMPVETYVGAGQSNMVGYVNYLKLPLDLQQPIKNGKVFVPVEFEIMQAGINNQGETGPLRLKTHGMEVSFMSDMTIARQHEVRWIKYAVSGTNLAGQWKPTAIENGIGLFYNLVMTVDAAKAVAYEEGIKLDIKAVIWWQGEADSAQPKFANLYGKNLSAFIQATRHYLNAPDSKFIIIKIHPYYPYGNIVRAAEDSVSTVVSNVRTVETIDQALGALHLNSPGYVTVGHRTAATILNWK